MIVVITNPGMMPGEPRAVELLLEAGATHVHVRKPDASPEEVARYINQINPVYYDNLSMHYHHELALEFSLGGLHKSSGFEWPVTKKARVSGSLHSIVECACVPAGVSYVFLSPVFDSLSKTGYMASPHIDAVSDFLGKREAGSHKVIALGGINPGNANLARQFGFDGVAALGGVWVCNHGKIDIDATLHRFQALETSWTKR